MNKKQNKADKAFEMAAKEPENRNAAVKARLALARERQLDPNQKVISKSNLTKGHRYELAIECRRLAPAIMKRVIDLTESEHGPTALKACSMVLDRAYGKAAIEVNLATTQIDNASAIELAHAAAQILANRIAEDAEDSADAADEQMMLDVPEAEWDELE